MAPSRVDDNMDNQVADFDAPLKAAPKLVAPEPGTIRQDIFSLTDQQLTRYQNTVQDRNQRKQAKATHVQAVRTNKSAPRHQKDPTQTSPSSPLDYQA